MFGFPEDADQFRMPHITLSHNNEGVQIAKAEVQGKIYEARHPHDGGKAAEALGAHIAKLQKEGKLQTGII